MKNKILQIKNKYRPLIDKAWEDYRALRKNEEEEISKELNFEGKYLKIYDPLNEQYIFIKVKNQCTCPYFGDHNKTGIRLVGLGFDQYQYVDLSDSVWLMLDDNYTYEIDVSNLNTEIDNIEEISSDDFKKYYFEASKKAEDKFLKLL